MVARRIISLTALLVEQIVTSLTVALPKMFQFYTKMVSNLNTFNSLTSNFHRIYGLFLSRGSAWFVLLPLLLSTVMSFGFMYCTKLQSMDDDLVMNSWRSDKSKFFLVHQKTSSIFGSAENETCSVFLSLKNESESIFTDSFVTEYLWLRNAIESITVPKSEGQ